MKYLKKYILIAAVIVTVPLWQSCSDFLEEKSQSEVIPTTTDDFSEFLIGNGYPDRYAPDYSFVSLLDDDMDVDLNATVEVWDQTIGEWGAYVTKNSFLSSSSSMTYAAFYQWQPTMSDYDGYGEANSIVETSYKSFYQKITGCNAVLDGIDEARGTDESRARVKAEALALRALYYFQLVNIFGDPYNYNPEALGVPLKLDAAISDAGIPRSTVRQAYEEVIVPDLEEACRLTDNIKINFKDYHINQPAMHILLSRVYLFMEKYDKCIEHATKAFSQGAVLSDIQQLIDNKKLSNADPFSYVSNNEILFLYGPGAVSSGFYPYDPGRYVPALRNLYDSENDLRVTLYNFPVNSYDYITIPHGGQLSQMIRTAEAYLNRAEAKALSGDVSGALRDLNDLRRTRIKNYQNASYSGDELLSQIRDERRKEFCYQGFRWFDLRRYGMPELRHEFLQAEGQPIVYYILRKNDPLYTVPLPTSLSQQNRELQQSSNRSEPNREPVNN